MLACGKRMRETRVPLDACSDMEQCMNNDA